MNRYTIAEFPENQRIPVAKLMPGMLGMIPISYDFSKPQYGDDDRTHIWEYYGAVQCDECGTWAFGQIGEGECEHCQAYISTSEPMMNYFYPLDDIDPTGEELKWAAKRLASMSLVLVIFDPDESPSYALALTGGGMNFAWEICEAFTALGYLPPMHFADLPGMAGKGESDTDRYVVAACKRSAETTITRAQYALDRLTKDYPGKFTDSLDAIVYDFKPEPNDDEEEEEPADDEE